MESFEIAIGVYVTTDKYSYVCHKLSLARVMKTKDIQITLAD